MPTQIPDDEEIIAEPHLLDNGKFMGKLLAFMFMVNMVMAMTALPAFAVWLERLFPRKKPVKAPGLAH